MAFDEISDKKFSIENLNIKVFKELSLNHNLCLMDKIIKKLLRVAYYKKVPKR